MSLVGQISDKNSRVRRFLAKFESPEGCRNCLAQLQSTKPIRQPLIVDSTPTVFALIGTTVDYLIRYAAMRNSLVFENTVAHRAIEKTGPIYDMELINDLYDIGKCYLDGRDAAEQTAVYSATALALLDNVYRSGGRFPEFFYFRQAKFRSEQIELLGLTELRKKVIKARIATMRIKRRLGDNQKGPVRVWLDKSQMTTLGIEFTDKEKSKFLVSSVEAERMLRDKVPTLETRRLLDKYINTVGGDLYIQDVSSVVKTYIDSINSDESEMFGARLTVSNRAMENSWMVGGADFDCVIDYCNRHVMTDIKTTVRSLSIGHFRQILCYALLHDEEKDGFGITDIGIYHARSGSFRYLSLDEVIEQSLPKLRSISVAKQAFIKEICI